jgi:hypothetical protein
MSNNIPMLLQRNLDVFAENDPARRRALIDEYYLEDCVFYDPNNGVHRGRDEIDRIAGTIKATHPDFGISLSPSRMCRAMAGESAGYPARRARLPPMPEPISSSRMRVASPPSISSSTSCPELPSAGAQVAEPGSRRQLASADSPKLQNMPFVLLDVAGTGCNTSQCSTIFPSESKRKMSTPAVSLPPQFR